MGDAGPSEIGQMLTFDQLLRLRAADTDQTPLLAYPKSPLGINDYEFITGAALNQFVDGAVKELLKSGFSPVYEETIAGVYALSDIDYVVTNYALGRLGYTPFLLSPRLPASAVATLLEKSNSKILLHGLANNAFAESVRKISENIRIHPIITKPGYDREEYKSTPLFERVGIDNKKEHWKTYLVLHSSGSTGLPKPIRFSNKRLTITFLTAQHKKTWLSVPFSHAFGMVCFTQAIYTKSTMYVMNGHVPQTHDTVTSAILAARPQVVWTVPYVLKLLAEKQDGIDVLKDCEMVSSSGSRLPDELGDLLTRHGVFVGLTFGATEVATTFTSLTRPRDDIFWNYMSVQPHVVGHMEMRPVDDGEEGACEAIVLKGHRSLAVTNSNDPPGSFHTSDMFVEHPTLKGRWKFVGRRDDRITLLNGEKVLPLPIEGRIRAHGFVREAVLFGVDRPAPGLMLFRALGTANLSVAEYIDAVWPTIQDANIHAEAFSQISQDMIIVLGEDVDCPTTDKSSIKRGQIYRDFAKDINEVYIRLESAKGGPVKALSVRELKDWIVKKFEALNISISDKEADFFTLGVDSLKAIQMRGLIVKELDLGGRICPSLVVYDAGNTKRLAVKLHELRVADSEVDEDEKEIDLMKGLIEKYSKFEVANAALREESSEGAVVILTGATGSLGCQILNRLVMNPNVSRIYALVRTLPNQSPRFRLINALKKRKLSHPFTKITALSASFVSTNLGLTDADFEKLKAETTHIIHCAWEVNFALSVQSFEPQIQALHSLLNLSLNTKHKSTLSFCSSVGTAMATPPPATIHSGPIVDLHQASKMGYGRAKLIGERIVEAAVEKYGAKATILRIGQIIPAREIGSQVWNVDEALPLMIRTAESLGVLPEVCSGGGLDQCRWFEADALAEAIVELGGPRTEATKTSIGEGLRFYNLVNPKSFSWKDELLPKLKAAGLKFGIVSWKQWLKKVEDEEDTAKNPSKRLLEFWEAQGVEGGDGRKEITFQTSLGEENSSAMRCTKRAVDGDLVEKMVMAWKEVW